MVTRKSFFAPCSLMKGIFIYSAINFDYRRTFTIMRRSNSYRGPRRRALSTTVCTGSPPVATAQSSCRIRSGRATAPAHSTSLSPSEYLAAVHPECGRSGVISPKLVKYVSCGPARSRRYSVACAVHARRARELTSAFLPCDRMLAGCRQERKQSGGRHCDGNGLRAKAAPMPPAPNAASGSSASP